MAATDTLSPLQFESSGDTDEDDRAAEALTKSVDYQSDPTASLRHGGEGNPDITLAARQKRSSPFVQQDYQLGAPRFDQAQIKADIAGVDKFNRPTDKVRRNGR